LSGLGWGLVLLSIYVLLVILARWIYIARTNMVWTRAQAKAITKRLSLQVDHASSRNCMTPVTHETLGPLVEAIEKQNPTSERSGIIGWNGSHQIAQWVLMHEAERLLLPTLSHEQLVARLERARGQLGDLPQARREAWETLIDRLLADKDKAGSRLDCTYRAYLDEVLGEIYEASNGTAIQLAGLYNRATWIILVALLPLAVLAGFGYGLVLVAGAIGGLVSRMQRLVFSSHVPITYGSSWGPLFCAPVLGALAAWAGLVLISLMQTAGVLKLTGLHTTLHDLKTPTAALLGIAILLGLSERFLVRLEKQAQAVIDPDQTGPLDAPATPTMSATKRAHTLSLPTPPDAPATTADQNGDAPRPPPVPEPQRGGN
jgi:hypothetical protein